MDELMDVEPNSVVVIRNGEPEPVLRIIIMQIFYSLYVRKIVLLERVQSLYTRLTIMSLWHIF
jgi:hypothetical protein